MINSTGQTALDIALFWNNRDVANLLQTDSAEQNPDSNLRNFFSLNLLNRCSDKRKDKTWMRNKVLAPNTRFIAFHNLSALAVKVAKKQSYSRYMLSKLEYRDIEIYMAADPATVFLGVVHEDRSVPLTFEEPGLFAVDLSAVGEETVLGLSPGAMLMPGYPLAMQLSPEEAGIYAEARSMMAWHDRYQFCPTCGSPSRIEEGGYKRVCQNMDCRSHNGTVAFCNFLSPAFGMTLLKVVQDVWHATFVFRMGTHFVG